MYNVIFYQYYGVTQNICDICHKREGKQFSCFKSTSNKTFQKVLSDWQTPPRVGFSTKVDKEGGGVWSTGLLVASDDIFICPLISCPNTCALLWWG